MTGRVKAICRFGDFDEGLENTGFFVVGWRIPFLSPSLLLLRLTKLPFEVLDIGTDHIDMGIEQGIACGGRSTLRPSRPVAVRWR